MKFRVRKPFLDKGKRNDADNCPAALCIRNRLKIPDDELVLVGRDVIRIGETTYVTPPPVRKFLLNWDYDKPGYEFDFELPIEEVAL